MRLPILLLTLALAFPASAQSVVDGDTIKLAGTTYRLFGIDAPESGQTCADGWAAGRTATNHLAALVRGYPVACQAKTMDRYGRTVAICRANGQDLGEAMVRRGMALASSWRYLLEDWLAWFEGAGLHGHRCEKPSAWRAHERDNRR